MLLLLFDLLHSNIIYVLQWLRVSFQFCIRITLISYIAKNESISTMLTMIVKAILLTKSQIKCDVDTGSHKMMLMVIQTGVYLKIKDVCYTFVISILTVNDLLLLWLFVTLVLDSSHWLQTWLTSHLILRWLVTNPLFKLPGYLNTILGLEFTNNLTNRYH